MPDAEETRRRALLEGVRAELTAAKDVNVALAQLFDPTTQDQLAGFGQGAGLLRGRFINRGKFIGKKGGLALNGPMVCRLRNSTAHVGSSLQLHETHD